MLDMQKDSVQPGILFSEGQGHRDVFLVPAGGSSLAVGLLTGPGAAWATVPPARRQVPGGRPSSATLPKQLNNISYHAQFTEPSTEVPMGECLHTRAQLCRGCSHGPVYTALLWAFPAPVTRLEKRSSSSPTPCYPKSAK